MFPLKWWNVKWNYELYFFLYFLIIWDFLLLWNGEMWNEIIALVFAHFYNISDFFFLWNSEIKSQVYFYFPFIEYLKSLFLVKWWSVKMKLLAEPFHLVLKYLRLLFNISDFCSCEMKSQVYFIFHLQNIWKLCFLWNGEMWKWNY